MLHFLRRLRILLLGKGHLRQYFIYAIGEILLVMIGILLALQVNNWNTVRVNRVLEAVYRRGVLVDLRLTARNMSTHVRRWNSMAEATDYLIEVIEDPSSYTTSTRLAIALRRMSSIQVPPIVDVTYEDLLSTGNIRLFQDLSVRDEIARLYEDTLEIGQPFFQNRLDLRARRVAFQILPVQYYQGADEICPFETSIYECPDIEDPKIANLKAEILAAPDFLELLKIRRWDIEIGLGILKTWQVEVAKTLIDLESIY